MYEIGTMPFPCGLRTGDLNSSPISGLRLVTATCSTWGFAASV
jgi:hypothetical protein